MPQIAQLARSWFSTRIPADGCRWYHDLRILESWKRDSGTEVRFPMHMTSAETYQRWFVISVHNGLRLLSELAREKMWSRIHLIPLLTAEEDRDLVRRHYADLAREKELMGSNTAVYNSDRYVTPFQPFRRFDVK